MLPEPSVQAQQLVPGAPREALLLLRGARADTREPEPPQLKPKSEKGQLHGEVRIGQKTECLVVISLGEVQVEGNSESDSYASPRLYEAWCDPFPAASR